ncbi:MAG: glutaredoxin family protein [Bacteriovoracia bacterium]
MGDINQKIEQLIQSKPVHIFMKGSPNEPQCGFSSRACQILQASGVTADKLSHFDILSDQEMREAVKQYSEFFTYPQVYIKGQLVGGSDDLMELYESGQLKQMLEGVV